MKKALPAITLFVLFLSCSVPAASQYSLNDRLILAARNGDTAEVQSLLDKGANIEAKDSIFGETALMIAAEAGKTDLLEFLLKKGANIEARDSFGETPLMVALSGNRTDVMELLLKRGANIEAKSKGGGTVLTEAALNGDTDAVRMLIKMGANIQAKGDSCPTPLWEVVCVSPQKSYKQRSETIKLLLSSGANVDDNYKGVTLLDCANRKGPAELVDLLAAAHLQRQQLAEARLHDPKAQFADNLQAFEQNPTDEALREKVISWSVALQEAPAIPEDARQLFIMASGQIPRASTPAALDQPIGLLRKALEIAPWWGNAYYNLSLALEMRGQYDDAIRQMNYYLELKPAEADASKARAHLTVLQTEKDTADQAHAQLNADNEKLIKAAAANPSAQKNGSVPITDSRYVWTDPATGLTWTKKDNGYDVDWYQAVAYCGNLHLGGKGEWRLPTIDELQGIYDPSVEIPGYQGDALGSNPVIWHVKGNITLSSVLWSAAFGGIPLEATDFYFVNGNRAPQRANWSRGMRVLCVRRSGE